MAPRFLAALLLAALAPASAAAHDILHRVEPGGAVAVKVYETDGDVVNGARYDVYSPRDPGKPFQTGRTDKNGYLSFVPDAQGVWRVKVTGDDGHGIDVRFEAGPGARAAAAGRDASAYMRPALGVVVLCAIFAALYAISRRRRPDSPPR